MTFEIIIKVEKLLRYTEKRKVSKRTKAGEGEGFVHIFFVTLYLQ